MAEDIEKLKRILNYQFTDRKLLLTALTHRSYAVEHQFNYDNQRLEFLGDAVLELALSDYLYKRYPEYDEGFLTRIRSVLACEGALAGLARHFSLGAYLLMGRGEIESGGAERESTLADLFEAVIGAMYLDGGWEQARNFIEKVLLEVYPDPAKLLTRSNPKGALQELAQRSYSIMPEYEVLNVTGPEHLPCFEVKVSLGSHSAIGSANSRKAAETIAASNLLQELESKTTDTPS